MARAKFAVASRKRRKRLLKMAKGFRGSRSKLLRQAYGAVDRAMAMAYDGRKQKKRLYRRLWTVRINAACRAAGMSYSALIDGLKKAGVAVDRKMLSDLAVHDSAAFGKLMEMAKGARQKATATS